MGLRDSCNASDASERNLFQQELIDQLPGLWQNMLIFRTLNVLTFAVLALIPLFAIISTSILDVLFATAFGTLHNLTRLPLLRLLYATTANESATYKSTESNDAKKFYFNS